MVNVVFKQETNERSTGPLVILKYILAQQLTPAGMLVARSNPLLLATNMPAGSTFDLLWQGIM